MSERRSIEAKPEYGISRRLNELHRAAHSHHVSPSSVKRQSTGKNAPKMSNCSSGAPCTLCIIIQKMRGEKRPSFKYQWKTRHAKIIWILKPFHAHRAVDDASPAPTSPAMPEIIFAAMENCDFPRTTNNRLCIITHENHERARRRRSTVCSCEESL
jgi:hypothetical protein